MYSEMVSSNSDLENAERQGNSDIALLHQRAAYTYITSAITGILFTATITLLPQYWVDYNINGVLNPFVDLIIGVVFFVCYVCWSVWATHGDTPSTAVLLQELYFVMTRAPMNMTMVTFSLRAKAVVSCITLIASNFLGVLTGLAIYKEAVTMPDYDAVGQMTFENTLLSHNTTMFFVVFVIFIDGMLTNQCYLGFQTERRMYPRYDHDNSMKLAPYRAAFQAVIAMFTVPLMGGLLNFEYVWATAIVSKNLGDTEIFTGMMFVGSLCALLVSWLIYIFPFIQPYIKHMRRDIGAGQYAAVEMTEPTTTKKR